MDPATAAAIAALAVSIMAMAVALAQAVQQYLITGQLIRMCDGVVYGKMPGQGRRVWEYAQFRFRVVYAVPQISLRSSLWSDCLPQHASYSKGHLPVPDLRRPAGVAAADLRRAIKGLPAQQQPSAHSAIAGEASWVSFSRVVQHASGNDLFYELVEGDADRCPADLPAVPMQVSMRDVVTVALMAGLRCTDASFEDKSLTMEGAAGTIATSSHPLLGPILQFRPRNQRRPPGLRIGGGSVSPLWMARMWDTIVIAGRHFDMRQRRHYETYEDYDWVTYSGDRTVAMLDPPSRQSLADSWLRMRRNSGQAARTTSAPTTYSISSMLRSAGNGTSTGQDASYVSALIRPSRHDGDWEFESDTDEAGQTSHIQPRSTDTSPKPTPRGQSRQLWLRHWISHQYKRLQLAKTRSSHPDLSAFIVDVEGLRPKQKLGLDSIPKARPQPSSNRGKTRQQPKQGRGRQLYTWNAPTRRGRKPLDGQALQEYIDEKKLAGSSPARREKLLLTWPASDGDEAQEDRGRNISDSDEGFGNWQDAYRQIKRERSLSYVERWRDVLQRTQRSRSRAFDDEDERRSMEASSTRPPSRSSVATTRKGSVSRVRSRNHSSSQASHRPRSTGSVFDPAGEQRRGRARNRSSESAAAARKHKTQTPHPFKRGSPRPKAGASTPPTLDIDRIITYGSAPVASAPIWAGLKQKERIPFGELPQSKGTNVFFADEESIDGTPDGITDYPSTMAKDEYRAETSHQNIRSERPMPTHQASQKTHSVDSPNETLLELREAIEASLTGDITGDVDDAARNTDLEVGKEAAPAPTKSILKPSRPYFPEYPDSVREGVAPLSNPATKIPSGYRWTKINRRLVNPEALHMGRERFEEKDGYVIVLRVLAKDEIEAYAAKTAEIREMRGAGEVSPSGQPGDTTGLPSQTGSVPSESTDEDRNDDQPSQLSSTQLETEPSSIPAWSEESVLDPEDRLRISESPSGISEEGVIETLPSFVDKEEHRAPDDPTDLENPTPSGSPPPGEAPPTDSEAYRPRSRLPSSRGSKSGRRAPSESTVSLPRRGKLLLDWTGYAGSDSSTEEVSEYPSDDSSLDTTLNDRSLDKKRDWSKGSVDWFWICQADAVPGYFATPWQGQFSESVCLGAIAIMLEVLQYFTSPSTLNYVETQPSCERWVYEGRSTHPSYAINAMGGIIVSGTYQRVRFGCLETDIPPIRLLRSYDYQVRRASSFGDESRAVVERLGELMGLDSWLSFCGRLPEICDGRNNLLRRMPSLVQKLMFDFEYVFRNLDRTATEGGLQIIKETAESMVHELERQNLSDAEQLFCAVAMLRAAKMALCVVQGPSTAKLRQILLQDVQVYLV